MLLLLERFVHEPKLHKREREREREGWRERGRERERAEAVMIEWDLGMRWWWCWVGGWVRRRRRGKWGSYLDAVLMSFNVHRTAAETINKFN